MVKLLFSQKGKIFLLFSTLLFFVFGTFISGYSTLIFNDIGSDTFRSYYPWRILLANKLKASDYLFYSHKIGAGGGVSLTFYLNPFHWISFLSPVEYIHYTITAEHILKLVLLFIFSYKYLGKIYKIKDDLYLGIASIAIPFSGYALLWSQHMFFMERLLYLLMFLYGFELFIKNNKILMLIISLLFLTTDFYLFYQSIIFLPIYTCFRLCFFEGKLKQKIFLLFTVFCIIISVSLINNFTITQTLSDLSLSTRTASDSTFLHKLLLFFKSIFSFKIWNKDFLITIFSRFFSNFTLGCAMRDNYKGIWNLYEAPQIYVSVLSILLIPQLIIVNKKLKKRLLVGVILFLGIVMLIMPAFSIMFHGFQYANFRWTYFLVPFQAFAVTYVLNNKNDINKTILFVTSVIYIIFIVWLSLAYDMIMKVMVHNFFIIFIIILYTLILSIKKIKSSKVFLPFLVLLFSSELIYEGYFSNWYRNTIKGNSVKLKQHYFDNSKGVISSLNKSDTTFFRLIKDKIDVFYNDSYVHSYNGVSTYHSTINKNYARFLKYFDVHFNSHNALPDYLESKELLDLMSVKYSLKENDLIEERTGYIPFGASYERYISFSDFDKLTTSSKLDLLKKYIVIEDIDEKDMIGEGFLPVPYSTISSYSNRGTKQFEKQILNKKNNSKSFIFNDKSSKEISLTLKTSKVYDIIVSTYLNGEETNQFTNRLSFGINQFSFNCKDGCDSILVEPLDIKSNVSMVCQFSFSKEKMINPSVLIPPKSIHVDNSTVEGIYNVASQRMVFFSIPFDDKFKVYVNDEQVKAYKVNLGFIGVMLKRGESTVKLVRQDFTINNFIIMFLGIILMIVLYYVFFRYTIIVSKWNRK